MNPNHDSLEIGIISALDIFPGASYATNFLTVPTYCAVKWSSWRSTRRTTSRYSSSGAERERELLVINAAAEAVERGNYGGAGWAAVSLSGQVGDWERRKKNNGKACFIFV